MEVVVASPVLAQLVDGLAAGADSSGSCRGCLVASVLARARPTSRPGYRRHRATVLKQEEADPESRWSLQVETGIGTPPRTA